MDHIRYAIILAVAANCVPARAQSFRMFFDVSGNAGNDAAPHPGSETLSYTNPILPPGGGRLYIYGEFLVDLEIVLAASYDITIDGGSITEAWNYNGPGQDTLTGDRRWDAAEPNPVMNPGSNTVRFAAANLTHFGLVNDPRHDVFDIQHDESRNFGDTLLGYVDVVGEPDATIWMTIGEHGFVLQMSPGDPRLFLGFGDESLRQGQSGIRTRLPEASIIPEPSACVLLLLGGLLIAGRR